MLAERVAAALLASIHADGRLEARSFAEAGYGRCPAGVQLRLPSGAVAHVQVVTCGPEGAPAAPLPASEHGPVALPEGQPAELPAVEQWLAERLRAAAGVTVALALGDTPGRARASVRYGAVAATRDGGRAWIYLRDCTAPGRAPGSGPTWHVPQRL